jgi:hypothetical protein
MTIRTRRPGPVVALFALLVGAAPFAVRPAAKRIEIEGPRHVGENGTAYFKCIVHDDDGSTSDVTSSASWTTDSWYARFESEGKLKASLVTADQWCRITAAYEGLSDTHEITIDNTAKALTRLAVSGPSSVPENGVSHFVLWASFDDGTTEDVTTKADWSTGSWTASFESPGRLASTPVTENKWIRIQVSFEGLTASHDVIVENTEIKIVRIKLSGPREVEENGRADYTCTAYDDDGRTEDVTSASTWTADSWSATIYAGRLETKAVSEDQWFKLSVVYRGLSASLEVKIVHKIP